MPHHGMTPHISGTSLSAQARYAAGVREILECWFSGRPIRDDYLIVHGGKLAGGGSFLQRWQRHGWLGGSGTVQKMRGRHMRVDRGALFSWGPELTVSVPRPLGRDLTPILKGVAAAFKERGRHVVTSQIAHPVVLDACAYLGSTAGLGDDLRACGRARRGTSGGSAARPDRRDYSEVPHVPCA